MIHTRTLICILCIAAVPVAAAAFQQKDDLGKQFEDLDTKGDHAGIVALWKQHPADALGVIDGYLEGALAKIEKGGDANDIKKDQERALRGAKAASEAFGHPIFSDYAASFVGWNSEQQKKFREGQKVSGAASAAFRKKDYETAKKEAQKCIDLARPLGDWWGYSGGLSMLANAEEQLGNLEVALDTIQQARVIHHDLGFVRDEYRDTVTMARILVSLDRRVRARIVIDQGIELSKIAKNKDGPKALEELKAKLDEKK
ncbi:MAG: hypothetical protein ACKVS6_13880 [Planctomycetota bacterium]